MVEISALTAAAGPLAHRTAPGEHKILQASLATNDEVRATAVAAVNQKKST
jgi:hypothetical protein